MAQLNSTWEMQIETFCPPGKWRCAGQRGRELKKKLHNALSMFSINIYTVKWRLTENQKERFFSGFFGHLISSQQCAVSFPRLKISNFPLSSKMVSNSVNKDASHWCKTIRKKTVPTQAILKQTWQTCLPYLYWPWEKNKQHIQNPPFIQHSIFKFFNLPGNFDIKIFFRVTLKIIHKWRTRETEVLASISTNYCPQSVKIKSKSFQFF